MEMELLEVTPVSAFLETPIKRSLSREEIGKVIGTLTNVLKRINLEMNLHKTNTTDGFDTIQNHELSLKAGYDDIKEKNTKKMEENENRFLAKENTQLKQKLKHWKPAPKKKINL